MLIEYGQTIWKYTFTNYANVIEMPADAKIVSVGMQRGRPCMWAVVNPDAPKVQRVFTLYGTGHEIEAPCVYLGRVVEGPFVWHIVEEQA